MCVAQKLKATFKTNFGHIKSANQVCFHQRGLHDATLHQKPVRLQGAVHALAVCNTLLGGQTIGNNTRSHVRFNTAVKIMSSKHRNFWWEVDSNYCCRPSTVWGKSSKCKSKKLSSPSFQTRFHLPHSLQILLSTPPHLPFLSFPNPHVFLISSPAATSSLTPHSPVTHFIPVLWVYTFFFFLPYPVRVCRHVQAFHTLSSWPACADLWRWRPPICWSRLDRLTVPRASCTFDSFCTASFDGTTSALKPFNSSHLGSLLMTQVNVIVAAVAAVVEMAR